MTEFISRKYGNEGYEVIIKTDSEADYKSAEEFARKLIDHAKPVTDNNVGGKWIPVTERLPRPFVSVLTFLPDHAPCPTVHECYITPDGEWCSAVVYGVEDGDVTYWMPLPEPPEEVG